MTWPGWWLLTRVPTILINLKVISLRLKNDNIKFKSHSSEWMASCLLLFNTRIGWFMVIVIVIGARFHLNRIMSICWVSGLSPKKTASHLSCSLYALCWLSCSSDTIQQHNHNNHNHNSINCYIHKPTTCG